MIKLFASMRFGSAKDGHPDKSAAPALKAALAEKGIELVIVDPKVGDDITEKVFGAMEECQGFVAFGTRHYGEKTGNAAATDRELAYWQNTIEKNYPERKLIPIQMLKAGETFASLNARVLFGSNANMITWPIGSELSPSVPDAIAKACEAFGRNAAGVAHYNFVHSTTNTFLASAAADFACHEVEQHEQDFGFAQWKLRLLTNPAVRISVEKGGCELEGSWLSQFPDQNRTAESVRAVLFLDNAQVNHSRLALANGAATFCPIPDGWTSDGPYTHVPKFDGHMATLLNTACGMQDYAVHLPLAHCTGSAVPLL